MRIVTKFKSSLLYKYIASFTIPIAIISLLFSVVLFVASYQIIDNFVIKQFESTLRLHPIRFLKILRKLTSKRRITAVLTNIKSIGSIERSS